MKGRDSEGRETIGFRWPVAVKNERWKPMVSLPSESLPFISALHHFFTFGPSRVVGARTLGMRNLSRQCHGAHGGRSGKLRCTGQWKKRARISARTFLN